MLRPSHVLAFVTAILAAEASPASESVLSEKVSQSTQSSNVTQEELSEKEQIEYEARRQLGYELRNL